VNPRSSPAITRRERELIAEVLRGKSDKAIASTLGTRVQTVRNQLSTLYRKLGVSSRLELAVRFGPQV